MTITRRDFLRGTTTLLLVPVVAAGCGSSMSTPADGGLPQDGGTPDGGVCEGVSTTGSVAAGGLYGTDHSHTLCVPTADLTSPPSGGATYPTSSKEAHTHTVTLTEAQLTMIQGGTMVTIDSSDNGHHHTFAIIKA